MTTLRRHLSEFGPTGWQFVLAALLLVLCYAFGALGLFGVI